MSKGKHKVHIDLQYMVDDLNARSLGINECEKLIFGDEFKGDKLDFKKWKPEITYYGGGNNEFQAYLNNPDCLFVKDGKLHIKPQFAGKTINNLWGNINNPDQTSIGGNTKTSQCTATQVHLGYPGDGPLGPIAQRTLPIVSGRVRTHDNFSFKYGRVEVEANLPKGDWLWPAIWMTATENYYGDWPRSAEIDIMESRGNSYMETCVTENDPTNKNMMAGNPHANDTGQTGCNYSSSTLHWGKRFDQNNYNLTSSQYKAECEADLITDYNIFGLYWTPTEFYTYVKNPATGHIKKVLSGDTDKFKYGVDKFWDKAVEYNGRCPCDNPWKNSKDSNVPFDTPFSLILNLAVGGYQFGKDGDCQCQQKNNVNGGYFKDFCRYNQMVNSGNPADAVGQAFMEASDLDGDWYQTWTGEKRKINIFNMIKNTTSSTVHNIKITENSYILIHYISNPTPITRAVDGSDIIITSVFNGGFTVNHSAQLNNVCVTYSILDDPICEHSELKIKNVRVYANKYTQFSFKGGEVFDYNDL
jgi:beta-glucanase (GH16 family)